jgi:hypothetical protein
MPNYDWGFWVFLVVAAGSNVLSIFYCLAYNKAKKELEGLKSHLSNADASLTKPTNSATDMPMMRSQSRGKRIY